MDYNAGMAGRWGVRRLSKWGALIAGLVVVGVFAASWFWIIFYQAHGWGLRFDEGLLTAHWGYPAEPASAGGGPYGWTFRPMEHRLGFRFLGPSWSTWPDGRVTLYLPLWLPLSALAVATAALWWLDRRRYRPGHCTHCGYNLTGNTTGRCPECGTPARAG